MYPSGTTGASLECLKILSIHPLNEIGLGANQTTARATKDSTDSMPTQFSLYDYFLKLIELIIDYLYNYFYQNDMSTTTPMRI